MNELKTSRNVCLFFFFKVLTLAPPEHSMSHNDKKANLCGRQEQIQWLVATEATFVQHSGIVTLASTWDAFPLMQRAQSRQSTYYGRVFINKGLASLSKGDSGGR